MKRTKIKEFTEASLGKSFKVCGWVRTIRRQKNFAFVEIDDGSTFVGIQVVIPRSFFNDESVIEKVTTGASIKVEGVLVESPGFKQKWELCASSFEVIGDAPAELYPLQKKKHSPEFLRTIAHLRGRTHTQSAVMRVRNLLAFATHEFFQHHGFLYVQTPVITHSDCEGSGEQFTVTALDLNSIPRLSDGTVDFSKDFFHRRSYLTVSGQLEGESMAMAFSDIYTFGPTFRAEKSYTPRHLAEFWMIEPEMAFAALQDNLCWAENYLRYLARSTLERCQQEIEFFDVNVEKGIVNRLMQLATASFAHLTYTKAIEILEKADKNFEFPIKWGIDLQSEHERYLTETYCKAPVFITDYPADIKSFYMRLNGDGKTVAAMDLLVPKIGEILGGSQREERYDVLKQTIIDRGFDVRDYDWYLQLRQYGTVPHSGFGAGFERLVQLMTGVENIRDVIPFPRYPGHIDF